MSRYIDTEKLCQKILDVEDYYKAKNNSNIEARIKYDFLINVVTPMVVGTPTEDVAPVVHAHWIGDPIPEENSSILTEYSVSRTCSHCGYSLNVIAELSWHYCPNCGAKITKGNEV